MSKPVARDEDICIGVCSHPDHKTPIPMTGKISATTTKTILDNKKIARLGDIVNTECGHTGNIISASNTFAVEGVAVARLGDEVAGYFVASIVEGSEKFQIL